MLDFHKVVDFNKLPLVPATALNMTQVIWEDMSIKDRQEGITALQNDIDKMTTNDYIIHNVENLQEHMNEMREMQKAADHMEEHLNDQLGSCLQKDFNKRSYELIYELVGLFLFVLDMLQEVCCKMLIWACMELVEICLGVSN